MYSKGDQISQCKVEMIKGHQHGNASLYPRHRGGKVRARASLGPKLPLKQMIFILFLPTGLLMSGFKVSEELSQKITQKCTSLSKYKTLLFNCMYYEVLLST